MSDSLQPQGLCSPPGSSVHGILQVRILAWIACQFLLQSIFLTLGSDPISSSLLLCRQILYRYTTFCLPVNTPTDRVKIPSSLYFCQLWILPLFLILWFINNILFSFLLFIFKVVYFYLPYMPYLPICVFRINFAL